MVFEPAMRFAERHAEERQRRRTTPSTEIANEARSWAIRETDPDFDLGRSGTSTARRSLLPNAPGTAPSFTSFDSASIQQDRACRQPFEPDVRLFVSTWFRGALRCHPGGMNQIRISKGCSVAGSP